MSLLWEYTDNTGANSVKPNSTSATWTAAVGWQVPSAQNGKKMGSVTFLLKKTGTPSNNAYAQYYDSSNVLQATSGSISADSISTSETEYVFTFSSAVTLATGGKIVFTGDYGDQSNFISSVYGEADTTADSWHNKQVNGTWGSTSSLGVWIKVWSSTSGSSPGDPPPPFTLESL